MKNGRAVALQLERPGRRRGGRGRGGTAIVDVAQDAGDEQQRAGRSEQGQAGSSRQAHQPAPHLSLWLPVWPFTRMQRRGAALQDPRG